jgi:hypothetical protein
MPTQVAITEDISEFVYNLKKHGIVTQNLKSKEFSQLTQDISLHRSMQAMSATYLFNNLSEQEKEIRLKKILSTLQDYYLEYDGKKDKQKIMELIPHLESVLEKIRAMELSKNVKDKYSAELYLLIGQIYDKWVRNYLKAKEIFISAVNIDDKLRVFSQIIKSIF